MKIKQATNIEIWWVECVRFLLGFIVIAELLLYRFVRDDIDVFFLQPSFHFSYTGFEWIRHLDFIPINVTYWALILSLFLFSIGKFKKVSLPLTAILFGYFFLYERAAFLNHWYLIWLLFIVYAIAYPLQKTRLYNETSDNPAKIYNIPFKLMQFLAVVVYFYSGLSKLNNDWILGYPMALLLPKYFGINSLSNTMVIIISNAITFFEISISILLLQTNNKVKNFAVIMCTIFHLLNLIFLPIGFFPVIMIILTLSFSTDFLNFLHRKIKLPIINNDTNKAFTIGVFSRSIVILFVVAQLLIPLRKHYFYSQSIWDGRGQLFSWSMFTRTIGGSLEYRVVNLTDSNEQLINLFDFGITEAQYSKMKRSSDYIYKFANHIKQSEKYKSKEIQIFVESTVSLNGRLAQLNIHPSYNFAEYKHNCLKSYPFVIPLRTPLLIE